MTIKISLDISEEPLISLKERPETFARELHMKLISDTSIPLIMIWDAEKPKLSPWAWKTLKAVYCLMIRWHGALRACTS